MLRLDHVMYVVEDLDEAARRIRFELGLDSYPGGEHSGVGTANRVIPLGDDQYVELMAVVDRTTATKHPVGSQVLEWLSDGEGLRAWCLSTDDIDGVAARLNLTASPWTRVRPDGVVIGWRLAGVESALIDPSLPFFIQWDCPPEQHPARGEADHTAEVTGISWLEVGGNPDKLGRWTAGATLPVRVVDKDAGPRALGIATTEGEVVLR